MNATSRPRVVIVAGKVPEPIRSGLDLRVRSQVDALSLTHDVTLTALAADGSNNAHLPADVICVGSRPQPTQDEIVRAFLANPTDPFSAHIDAAAAHRLQEVIARTNPDAVLMSRIHSWVYVDYVRQVTSAPVILDLDESADRLSLSFQQLPHEGIARSLHLRYTRAMALYEETCRQQADAILVSSDVEKEFLDSLLHDLPPVHVVVNAVPIGDFRAPQKVHERPSVIFTGNLSYPPNFYAAREIIDHVAPHNADMNFTIAGSHAPPSMKASIPDNVTVISPAQDIPRLLRERDVSVMPLRAGGGTRFKALEAMSACLPCVGTTTAFEGLDVYHGSEVLIADTIEDTSASLATVTSDQELRLTLVSNAYEYVATHHSIETLSRQLLEALAGCKS